MNIITLCEKGYIPDPLIRFGARRLSRRRLAEDGKLDPQQLQITLEARVREWRNGPIALATQAANDQHYEVPPGFFLRALGSHLKYSCCYWDDTTASLDEAERLMLEITAQRAGIGDGQEVLDLGCGWGSFTLWAAQAYPGSRFTAMSNSAPQREFIEATARQRGLSNVRVITADINAFAPDQQFDRIVSVEMLEHVRNHARLFERIASWLKPDGQFFAHVFCHHTLTYAYEDRGGDDWMSRHFFTGGMMPSYDLFTRYDEHLSVVERWWVDGHHYEKTSNAWLQRSDAQRDELIEILGGGEQGRLRLQRWRMFFLAVAEFFGIDEGREWGVGHYLFKPRRAD
ncbi:Cyclopropane-fatty-acyl-phospholipid synthase-like protein [Oceanococcus atlanticus]|uniref:Cyclopropane-fatty-acyl-phospholipid synthase-like protein n=1 Tax=Oceanococcus atlanticus TaxID=1317117 RepID=A0A1Y1SJ78_9GAMM|nr:cyclopropane-fatty-acyl-phospholipid synthase family protein [Oceanococcus atlanticus]ORE89608.1 Cyclopropane-fatty-acyl-phospholipid synthase-like protein [Oceanococcus atlanticus]